MVEGALKQDVKKQWRFDMIKDRLNAKTCASIAIESF